MAGLIPSGCQHLRGAPQSAAPNGPVKLPPQLKHEDAFTAPKSQLLAFIVASGRGGGRKRGWDARCNFKKEQ